MKKLIFILFVLSASLNAQILRTNPFYLPPVVSGSVAAQNLIKYSEQVDNAVWYAVNTSVTTNQANDLEGNATMELLTTTNNNHAVSYLDDFAYASVTAGVTYYWSFDVKRGTMDELKWSVYDRTNEAEIIEPTSYYSQTSADVQRVHCQFTAPAGCTEVGVYYIRDSGTTGTVYVGRGQLHVNLNAAYVETTSSIVE